ncbi:TniQ protein [Streptomyces sp. 3213]|uniref:TniQ family protein n=1 Tax=Streptomyces sp. 3213.3 TaxID=1855348 RepID=UPI00089704AA|nr:TniQ family protein [Streptomyces sp. 3213.3]SEE64598.1 TniQ protein [Streptomyces sp. 3213] [Streptomyces sp. 3213.3]
MMTPRRPLPCAVPPFHNETVDSFIARLAAANHLRVGELREHLGIRMLKKTPVTALLEPLSVVAGYPAATLRLAMPEFITTKYTDEPGLIERPLPGRPSSQTRPACRRCVHAAGITAPVECWITHERNVCLRHRLWIGTGCRVPEDQADLRRLPRVCHAQRHHRNVLARHGRRWVHRRFREATDIYLKWYEEREFKSQREVVRRMIALASATRRPITKAIMLSVIFHPEIVALTGLLASDRWERRLLAGNGGLLRFTAEITRREALVDYVLEETDDPLYEWIEQRISHHKFTSHYWRSYEVLTPEETTRPTQNRHRRDFRTNPLIMT